MGDGGGESRVNNMWRVFFVFERKRGETDFDADAFFFFRGRACASAGARPFVGGGGYLGYVGFSRSHAEGLCDCKDESRCVREMAGFKRIFGKDRCLYQKALVGKVGSKVIASEVGINNGSELACGHSSGDLSADDRQGSGPTLARSKYDRGTKVALCFEYVSSGQSIKLYRSPPGRGTFYALANAI